MVHPVRLMACLLISSSMTVHGLKLLDVGAPRTGTQSLYTAMHILNMKTLHSGYCRPHGCRVAAQQYLFEGGPVEPAVEMFKDYDVAIGEPWQLLYPEVMERFPEAKFVLTMQPSPEEWYASYERFVNTVYKLPTSVEGINTSMLEAPSHLRGVRRHGRPHGLDNIPELVPVRGVSGANLARYYNCEFDALVQDDKMVQQCIDGYNAHNANVMRMIPPEKLLVFNLTDGWEPLCKFLDVPIPSQPFPFIDVYTESPYDGQQWR
mmetsp:Transcript_116135/g.237531  ORF Transcript_116135/g.237531 Transcript_116135/m.237531 type:complete len:263 (+) Transcript_116135:83-871(+)